jgi:hypothetical protein
VVVNATLPAPVADPAAAVPAGPAGAAALPAPAGVLQPAPRAVSPRR